MSLLSKPLVGNIFGFALWACTVGWLVGGIEPLGNIVKFHAWFLAVLVLVLLLLVPLGFQAPKARVCSKFEHTYVWTLRTSRLLFLVWYGQFFYAGLLIFCLFAVQILPREPGKPE